MSTYQVINSIAAFADSASGKPLANGKLYFGRMDSDPKNNVGDRNEVYAVQAGGGELLMQQPIQLNNAGQPTLNGTPVQLKIKLRAGESAYSLQKDSAANSNKGYLPRVYSCVDLQTFDQVLEDASPFGIPMADVVAGAQSAGVSAPSVINVPTDFPTIQAAFASIQNKRIPVGSTCTIKVADGVYELSSGLTLNHPDGLRLRLVGNEVNEMLCTLTISGVAIPSFDMIVVSNGNKLGYLNGFNITLPAKADNWTGVLAVNGSFIYCGTKLRVNNFYYGIAARVGSEIICDYAKVDNAGDVGIWAYIGSTIQCNFAQSNNATDSVNNLGFGIQAEFGSSIVCTGASASGCRIAGIAALSNSTVRAHNSNASSNNGSGFYSSAEGNIENHNSIASSNARYGEERILGGTMYGNSVSLTGNALGAISHYAYFDSSAALGARIASNGDLRLDVNNSENIYFNTNGGVQAQIAHSPSSKSWPILRGSAINQPAAEAAGTDAIIDLNIKGKGTGRVFLASQRPNYVSADGASTGGTPSVRAEGSDTNIDLLLTGKGSGLVRMGKYTAGAVTVNGYISIKLEDGSAIKIPVEKV